MRILTKPLTTLFLFSISLGVISSASAQETVWADDIIETSSNLRQVSLGLDEETVLSESLYWCPRKKTNDDKEFIYVSFPKQIQARQVLVKEKLSLGAIQKIILFFEDGTKSLVYQNKYPRKEAGTDRLFSCKFPLTKEKVRSAYLELNTNVSQEHNCIGGIAISDEINILTESDREDLVGEKINLGDMVNDKSDEVSPLMSPDGTSLYFVRKNHSANMGEDDIWVTYQQVNGEWTKAVNLGAPINNRNANQILGFADGGDKIFLKVGKGRVSNDNIFTSQRFGRGWRTPQRLNIGLPKDKTIKDYTFADNGSLLMVAVETEASGFDIQYSQKQGQEWSSLKSIGANINTPQDETSVFLSADGQIALFSSNGHGGQGGQDLFMIKRLDEGSWTKWTDPVNCGNILNNDLDNEDIAITSNGEVAFISSANESGDLDLYKINLEESLGGEQETIVRSLEDRQEDFTAKGGVKQMVDLDKEPIEVDVLAKEKKQLANIRQEINQLEKHKRKTAKVLNLGMLIPDFEEETSDFEELRLEYASLQKEKKLIDNTAKAEDEELNSLKSRFNKAHNQEFTPKGGVVKARTKDSDLEEMKKRFNQYHGQEDTEGEEEELMDMEIGGNETVFDEEYDLEYYKNDFQSLQEKLWKELFVKLEPVVIAEIQKNTYSQVENQLLRKIEDDLTEEQKTRLHHQSILYYREIKKNERKLEGEKLRLTIPENKVTIQLRRTFEPEIRKILYREFRLSTMEKMQNELHYRFLKSEEELLQRVIK